MKTEYGNGRLDVLIEMNGYCYKKINEIKDHPESDRVEVNEKRRGLLAAYNDVIRRLDVKTQRMLKKTSQ